MGELTKTDNAGKNSPGPVYIYQDKIKYNEVSIFIKEVTIPFSEFYRHPDGQWVQKLELEKINPDTTFMKMHCFWMTQSKQIFREKQDAQHRRSVPSQDSLAITWSKIQVHNTFQEKNQFTNNPKSSHLAIEEDRLLRIRHRRPEVLDQVDMFQRHAQSPQTNKTSQDGLYQKLEDPDKIDYVQIETRLMIPGLPLEINNTLKIELAPKLISVPVVEHKRPSQEHSKTKCKEVAV